MDGCQVKILLILEKCNDNCGNNHEDESNAPADPNGRKYPNPCPVDDVAQFKDDESNAEQSSKAAKANVHSLIFHIISFLVCFGVFLHLMDILYHEEEIKSS